MTRPIHPGLAPNIRRADAILALKELILPWTVSHQATKKLEEWFEEYYKENAFAFSSGRGALYAILHAMEIGKGDEVLVEAFTCVAVVDAILATGAKPMYVDIKNDFTIDVDDARKKISSKTKAAIIQHTFAIPNYVSGLDNLLKTHNIPLVEDMAHGVGIVKDKEKVGTRGVAALFSFGRDKAFSSVSGGMVITKDAALSRKLGEFQLEQKKSSYLWTFQNLFHMVSFYFAILPFYDFLKIGKILLVLFQKAGLLAKPIDREELKHFSIYCNRLSPALAQIALLQLQSMDKFNSHRTKIVAYYQSHVAQDFLKVASGPLLRYPIFVENPKDFKLFMRKHGVYVGDWYSNVIDPKGTDIYTLFYKEGFCPTAELIAAHVVNLPTYPTLSDTDVKKIVTLYKAYVGNKRNNE